MHPSPEAYVFSLWWLRLMFLIGGGVSGVRQPTQFARRLALWLATLAGLALLRELELHRYLTLPFGVRLKSRWLLDPAVPLWSKLHSQILEETFELLGVLAFWASTMVRLRWPWSARVAALRHDSRGSAPP